MGLYQWCFITVYTDIPESDGMVKTNRFAHFGVRYHDLVGLVSENKGT